MRPLILASVLILSSLIGACNARYDRIWKDPAPAEPVKPATPSGGAL